MSGRLFLNAYLAPFGAWLDAPDITDVMVNRPGEVWIETSGGRLAAAAAPEITEQVLGRLARQIAAASHQGINREQPLLSATLPGGARVQIIGPPATRGGLALAIRKHAIPDLSLDKLVMQGVFSGGLAREPGTGDGEPPVLWQVGGGQAVGELLRAAVRRRRNIVIAGGTSSGKTTLLNALIKEIDPSERLVVIEDAAEISLPHDNALGLLATRGEQGEARVDADDLLAAALRMRPDRILLGELRGKEAFAFLRAVNTGHPGSITTVHADSPDGAIDQIALLALMSGVDLGWEMARAYARQVVDVIVQMRRVAGGARIGEVHSFARGRQGLFAPDAPEAAA